MLKEDEGPKEEVVVQAAEPSVPNLTFFGETLKVTFRLAFHVEVLRVRVGAQTFDLPIGSVGNGVVIGEKKNGSVRVTNIKLLDRCRLVTVRLPREPISIDWLPNGSFRVVF